jgi:glucose-1-phosphatase
MNTNHLQSVKNIIFDLGGVIINIEPLNILKDMEPEREQRFRSGFKRLSEQAVFDNFEIGQLSEKEFRQKVCREIKEDLSDNEFDRIWNRLLLDYPAKNIQIIQALKKSHRLFLLSNTNSIHYRAYAPQLEKTHGVSFSDLFEKVWLSHELGCRKPDEKIYNHVLEDANIKAEETLFADDTLSNLQAAEKLHIKTLHVERNSGLHTVFNV